MIANNWFLGKLCAANAGKCCSSVLCLFQRLPTITSQHFTSLFEELLHRRLYFKLKYSIKRGAAAVFYRGSLIAEGFQTTIEGTADLVHHLVWQILPMETLSHTVVFAMLLLLLLLVQHNVITTILTAPPPPPLRSLFPVYAAVLWPDTTLLYTTHNRI